MPRRGENIYKRKDNRWEGRCLKGYNDLGKPQFYYVYAKTYREVKQKLTDKKQLIEKNEIKNKKNLGGLCDEWLLLKRSKIKESSFVKYYTIINKHIKPVLGSYSLSRLDTLIIEEFSHSMLIKGLSEKTVKDVLIILKSILTYSKRTGCELKNNIDIIFPREKINEIRVLSLDEQTVLINYLMINIDNVKFGILISLLTGIRIGELCALKWSDISVETGLISISSTMQRLKIVNGHSDKKTRICITEPKSYKSKRVIPLTPYGIKLCEMMRVTDNNAYILTGKADKYIEPRLLQYRFSRYIHECGINDAHFHALRHTFATRCIEVGFDIKSLSEILGHSSVKVTLDRYVHSSMELKRKNMIKLSEIGF